MPEIPTRLANRLLKSDARYRMLECFESTKAPVIFDLYDIRWEERWHVIDGEPLNNQGDWKLFAMNSEGELHNIQLYHERDDMIVAYPTTKYVKYLC